MDEPPLLTTEELERLEGRHNGDFILNPKTLEEALHSVQSLFVNHFASPEGRRNIDIWITGDTHGDWGDVMVTKEDDRGFRMMKANTNGMIEKARKDADWFYQLEHGIFVADRDGYPVPQEVRKFYAPYLKNPKLKPKKKRGRKFDQDFYWCLRLSMLLLKDVGVPPTKNEATFFTDPDKKCGADFILDILSDLGRSELFTSLSIQERWKVAKKRWPIK
jgi:hypothetical protein